MKSVRVLRVGEMKNERKAAQPLAGDLVRVHQQDARLGKSEIGPKQAELLISLANSSPSPAITNAKLFMTLSFLALSRRIEGL